MTLRGLFADDADFRRDAVDRLRERFASDTFFLVGINDGVAGGMDTHWGKLLLNPFRRLFLLINTLPAGDKLSQRLKEAGREVLLKLENANIISSGPGYQYEQRELDACPQDEGWECAYASGDLAHRVCALKESVLWVHGRLQETASAFPPGGGPALAEKLRAEKLQAQKLQAEQVPPLPLLARLPPPADRQTDIETDRQTTARRYTYPAQIKSIRSADTTCQSVLHQS